MSTTLLSRADSFAGYLSDYTSRHCNAAAHSAAAGGDSLLTRFARSMVIDFQKWQKAIGYDLELIRQATVVERNAIERLLLFLGVNDWRDVEALAELGTPRAMDALRAEMKNPEIVSAILYYAPELAPTAK